MSTDKVVDFLVTLEKKRRDHFEAESGVARSSECRRILARAVRQMREQGATTSDILLSFEIVTLDLKEGSDIIA